MIKFWFTFWDKSLLYYHDKDFIGNGSPQFGTMIIILLVDIKELYSLLQNLMLLRMAHRLTSHHRALFAPMYFSGTSAHITSSSYFRAPFNVKDKDDFEKRVLSSSKPVLVDFHAEYEVLSYMINYHTLITLINDKILGIIHFLISFKSTVVRLSLRNSY